MFLSNMAMDNNFVNVDNISSMVLTLPLEVVDVDVDVEGSEHIGQEDLDNVGVDGDEDDLDVEGGDQRVFCLRPVRDDLFRQVL